MTHSENALRGARMLVEVAERFYEMGGDEGALRRLRNASQVAIHPPRDRQDSEATLMAHNCDLLEPEGLASVLAWASTKIDQLGVGMERILPPRRARAFTCVTGTAMAGRL